MRYDKLSKSFFNNYIVLSDKKALLYFTWQHFFLVVCKRMAILKIGCILRLCCALSLKLLLSWSL